MAPEIGSPDSLTSVIDAGFAGLPARRWLPYGSSVAPRGGRGFLMPIRIGDGIMRLEIDGQIVATATELLETGRDSTTRW